MKKQVLTMIIALCYFSFPRAHGQPQTISTCDCEPRVINCPGINEQNLKLLSYEEVHEYITNYRDNYNGKKETHTRAIYLSAKTFLFLGEFFKQSDYEGINIHFSVYGQRVAEGQNHSDEFILYFTPVRRREEDGIKKKSDYDTLRNFYQKLPNPSLFPKDEINRGSYAPGYYDCTTADWGGDRFGETRLNKIGGGDEGILMHNNNLLKGYKMQYRKNTQVLFFENKRHSRSIFFSRAVFLGLATFLSVPANKIKYPAIGVYFISYNKNMKPEEVPGQKHKKQISLAFTPMLMCGTYYEPDFCAYNEFVHLNKDTFDFILKGNPNNNSKERVRTINHGELCPDECPTGPEEPEEP